MKILVLGAGVVGVTTAYRLASMGHQVTVIERRDRLAAEASYANGGQLSYDFASPMASPSVLRHLADYLLGRDEAFRISLAADPRFVFWGARFLFNCTPSIARRNARALSQLAHRSHQAFDRLRAETGIDFHHRKAGKLVLISDRKAFAAARQRVAGPSNDNQWLHAVNAKECVELEPALSGWRGDEFVGGVYAPNDEIGDAHQFTNALAALATKRFGVEFKLGVLAREIHTHRGEIKELELSDGFETADGVVVCLGVNAPRLLSPLGISAPIWPVFGYSMTAPSTASAPNLAITDLGKKMVYSRIGDQLRIAGFADAGARTPENEEERLAQLERNAIQSLPEAARYNGCGTRWVGMRPSTPNSLPIVGATRIGGLFLNIGHGMFGWTLSSACADQIAGFIGSADARSPSQMSKAA